MIARAGSAALAVVLCALAAGCPGDPPIEPLFPADYAATYVEVRNCRNSADHDLHAIRVLADPLALVPYMDRGEPIPAGAILVKEEFVSPLGIADCSGPIVGWTGARRLEPGTDPIRVDWLWQRVDSDRTVLTENEDRCWQCHDDCVPPEGYEFTCAVP